MIKIGILALQGAVREHAASLQKCGAEAIQIKSADELKNIDGLILPGGESTTMRRLINTYGLLKPLQDFANLGKPVFGTCAGLILLARSIAGESTCHMGVLDVTVERNSFGRQVNSFEASLDIKNVGQQFPGVFIRAPHIVEAGQDVDILCEYDGRIVMARQKNLLGCAFHPELTEDQRVMHYFVKMVKEATAG